MTDQQRETLTPRQPRRPSRADIARDDIRHLWAQPQFRRFLSTLATYSGIQTGAYGSDGRHLAFAEGRRSLVFDILRTVERHHASTSALAQILAEELATQLETRNERRSDYDRHDELDPGGRDRSDDVDRPQFLDYSDEQRS
jgi:hypothetical protein